MLNLLKGSTKIDCDLWFNVLCALIGAVVVAGAFYLLSGFLVAAQAAPSYPRLPLDASHA
jgi:hypothetical protein